jgi:hypothetical protein
MGEMRLIRHCAEFLDRDEIANVPERIRGIYVLLQKSVGKRGAINYDVVYIGMSRTGIRARLKSHSVKKADLWSHFSIYSVWPNITDEEIEELEGLFRAIYRKDSKANSIAVQKWFRKLGLVRNDKFNWKNT